MEIHLVLPDSVLESVAQRAAELVADRPADNEDRFINAAEAAQFLGVTKQRIYQLASLDRIPSRKIGSSRRFLRSELRAWADDGGDVCP